MKAHILTDEQFNSPENQNRDKAIIGYRSIENGTKPLNIARVMPRILHFIDENGNNVDINAEGVNVNLKRDGTLEYYRSYGFAGRKKLTPVYGA